MELNEPVNGHENATTSLKVVLLVFAIVLIGALAYLIQATYSQPDTTAETPANVTEQTVSTVGWKTYTNTTDAYSFKHPADWTVSAKGGADPATGAPSFAATCVYEDGDTCLLVDTIVDVGVWSGTLQAYVTQYLTLNSAATATQTKTTLGGKDAIKVVFPNNTSTGTDSNFYKVAIYTLRDGKGFTLEATEQTKATTTAPKAFQATSTFNALAASFKFTK